jgi:hypothetical protein
VAVQRYPSRCEVCTGGRHAVIIDPLCRWLKALPTVPGSLFRVNAIFARIWALYMYLTMAKCDVLLTKHSTYRHNSLSRHYSDVRVACPKKVPQAISERVE